MINQCVIFVVIYRPSFAELFTAVEQDDIGKVRSMLQHGDVDVKG